MKIKVVDHLITETSRQTMKLIRLFLFSGTEKRQRFTSKFWRQSLSKTRIVLFVSHNLQG